MTDPDQGQWHLRVPLSAALAGLNVIVVPLLPAKQVEEIIYSDNEEQGEYHKQSHKACGHGALYIHLA